MTDEQARAIYKQNLKEIQQLVFQMNDMNSREVLGKVYFCLEALKTLLKI